MTDAFDPLLNQSSSSLVQAPEKAKGCAVAGPRAPLGDPQSSRANSDSRGYREPCAPLSGYEPTTSPRDTMRQPQRVFSELSLPGSAAARGHLQRRDLLPVTHQRTSPAWIPSRQRLVCSQAILLSSGDGSRCKRYELFSFQECVLNRTNHLRVTLLGDLVSCLLSFTHLAGVAGFPEALGHKL